MKFETSTSELKKKLQFLSPVINYQHASLAYRYLLLRKKGDQIELKGFDDIAVSSTFIDIDNYGGDEQEVYILAKHFMGLISTIDHKSIIFNISKEKCSIKFGKSTYKLKILDKKIGDETLKALDIDYYDIHEESDSSVKVNYFSTAYFSIAHCLSRDDSHRNLQNVFCKDGMIIACDGVKGAACEIKGINLEGVMLHRKACECVTSIKTTSDVYLISRDGKIYGHADDYRFVVTSEGDYPYDDIGPYITKFHERENDSFENRFLLEPEEISEKLSRILMFTDADTNSVQVNFGEGMTLVVDNQSFAEEILSSFSNLSESDFSLIVDGKSFKESLSKTGEETVLLSDGVEEPQYLFDGALLQFFKGLEN